MGAIFKATIPDETDEERRELERCVVVMSTHWAACISSNHRTDVFPLSRRMVAEAASGKSKHHQMQAQARAAAKARRGAATPTRVAAGDKAAPASASASATGSGPTSPLKEKAPLP